MTSGSSSWPLDDDFSGDLAAEAEDDFSGDSLADFSAFFFAALSFLACWLFFQTGRGVEKKRQMAI